VKDTVGFVFGFGMLLNAALFVSRDVHLWRLKTAKDVSVWPFASFNAPRIVGALHG